jgi:sec-independent protein translocase protein TatA
VAGLGTTEIIIIALVIMVLFGAKRLPDASRSLGRSLRIFKAETKGLRDDERDTDVAPGELPPTTAAPRREQRTDGTAS